VFVKGTPGPPNIPELYRVDLADNNRETAITNDQAWRKYTPVVNAASNLIVYSGEVVEPPWSRYLFGLPLSGGIPQPLTMNKYWLDIHPSWSPDGRTVYFTSSRSGHFEIWSIDIQTRRMKQITRSQRRGFDRFYGRESPDGMKLALLETGSSFSEATLEIISTN
jgi:Tol biopolymer transport system component